MNNKILTVKNLKTYFYSNKRCNKAVDGVSFTVEKGKIHCIVGESGCGKSVTATTIMRLLPVLSRIEEGEIIYHSEKGDIRIDRLPNQGKEIRAISGTDIAMIFQNPMTALNPVYTIGFQIMESLVKRLKMTKKEARDRAIEILKEMKIPAPKKRINAYPHEFSGGMRQRAMIGMAMSCNPKLLIADEPTTALDVTTQAQIFELIKNQQRRHNTALMLITHDMGVVAELADNVSVMYMGNIVESGLVTTVLYNSAHPYTKALLESIPILGRGKDQKISPIRGNTPNPFDRPTGCRFKDRCDYRSEQCEQMPDEAVVSDGHMVRCWNYREVNNNG